ncbi:MAG: ABC transporter permease, partial [Chloroflexi bacterium]|nr:ABC transporter permease [Chloroflexota bacterium]
MTTTTAGAEPISLIEERRSNPWLDAWRLFRRNKAAMVALTVLSLIFFIAITASLWRQA